ncbi:MAG: hypothetical protein ACLP59_06130 [Bryobacteraceae bacterium]
MRNSNWANRQWPELVVWAGLAVFCFTCLDSARLPAEAILAGPLLMAAGVVMKETAKRDAAGGEGRPRDSGAGSSARD